MKRKIISAVLVVCMLLTCLVAADYTANAVSTAMSAAGVPDTYSDVTDNPYGLTDDLDNATILQAWNWSYANMTKELDKVAEQGFTVIQISPPNEIKEATLNHKVTGESNNGWWMFYQPAGFQLNESKDNALGTKAELVNMVKEAHKRGIRVIADSVINHMGTAPNEDNINSSDPMLHVTPKAQQFEPEIYNNKLFHSPWFNMTYGYEWSGPQDKCTNDLTRGCTSRLPDLKTEDPRVQNAIYEYLQEMVDAGIDGFRFDAAKHIETPNDLPAYRSDFWVNTVNKVKSYAKSTYGKELLSYGEILNTCGYGRSYQHYFPFMKVTDSTIYRQVQGAVESGSAASAIPQNMQNGTKAQTVLWNESHDTYMDGESKNFSKAKRNKTWAAIAARDGITSMYLARPANLTQNIGVASETDWTSPEVAAVNKFNNVYAGQSEYLANANSVAIIGRGNKTQGGGAVLVNCSGTTKNASGLAVATMADGTYTDRVSGGSFVVSGGKITSGSIGGTGIAVLYDEPGPAVSATASGTYTTPTLSIKVNASNVSYATYSYNGSTPVRYTNSQTVTIGSASDRAGATYKVELKGYDDANKEVCSATYTYTKVDQEAEYTVTFKTNNVWTGTPNIYMWNSSSMVNGGAWPGTPMSGSGGVYTATVSNQYDRIIFNSGSNQTLDLTITGSMEYSLKSSKVPNGDGTQCNEVDAQPVGATVPTYYPGVQDTPTEATTASTSSEPPTTPQTDPPIPTEQPSSSSQIPQTDPPTSAPTQPTVPSKYEKGNVNRDNAVDITDVTFIQKYLVKLIPFDSEQKALADYNGDGKVTIKDATAIQYAIVGK